MGGRVRLGCEDIASMMGLTSLYEKEESPQLCLHCLGAWQEGGPLQPRRGFSLEQSHLRFLASQTVRNKCLWIKLPGPWCFVRVAQAD